MTSVTEIGRRHAAPALGTFERYLTVWVALCIVSGIVLGRLLPGAFQALGRMTVAEVNIPVAALIWLMIVPSCSRSISARCTGWPNSGAASP
jgi:ACR3 family arsenite transporter